MAGFSKSDWLNKYSTFAPLGTGVIGEQIDVSAGDWTCPPGLPPKGLHIGADGDLKVDLAGGGTGLIYHGLKAGQYFERAVSKIYSTGTSAGLQAKIVAEW